MKFVYILLIFIINLCLGYSPSGNYAPGAIPCPGGDLLREANGVSEEEEAWLSKREQFTTPKLIQFLRNVAKLNDSEFLHLVPNNNSKNYDTTKYGNMRIGLAYSGGGYRAMFAGAGQLAALDFRTPNSTKNGLGGLLDATTYLTGLSGGNWLVGSLALNNWTSVEEILNGNFSIWKTNNPVFDKDAKPSTVFANLQNWIKQVQPKKLAGYEVTFVDIWSRILAETLFKQNDTSGMTWSTLQDLQVFQDGLMPFPISLSEIDDGKNQNGNNTIMEINPYEFGSWDKSANSFIKIKYLGTEMDNGQITNQTCIAGYDNAAFLMGTSSNLFSFLEAGNSNSKNEQLKSLVSKVEMANEFLHKAVNETKFDNSYYGIVNPNPFKHNQFAKSYNVAESDSLRLIDGGSDNREIPFAPLLEPSRKVDLIIAFDNGGDTEYNWPNGTSLRKTFESQFVDNQTSFSFPYVPSQHTYSVRNYGKRPVFLGCNAKNLTVFPNIPPMVIYIPNSKYSYASNTSTWKMTYTDKERNQIIRNGFETASRNNLTNDNEWATCIGCAIIRRSQERINQNQSEICKQCFSNYCWDGTNSEDYTTVPIKSNTNHTDSPVTTIKDDSSKTSMSSTFQSSNSKSSSSSKNLGKLNYANHGMGPYWITLFSFFLGNF